MDAKESGFAELRLTGALFEGGRGQITQPGLEALTVVKQFNVFGDLSDGLLVGLEPARVDEFGFQGTPEALDGGVVVTVAAPGHGRLETALVEAAIFAGLTTLTRKPCAAKHSASGTL